MVANRLKNLVSLAKEAVKDVRQVLDELAGSLGPRAQPQPSLVRVPVRKSHPFNNLGQGSRRGLHTARTLRSAVSFQPTSFISRPSFRGPSSLNSLKFNSSFIFNSFKRPSLNVKFPSGLYNNFINLNTRNFSTSGGNATREAVQNLTSGLRCAFNNGGDFIMNNNMNSNGSKKPTHSYLTYHGSSTQNESEKIFKLSKFESSNLTKLGSFIEFKLPNIKLTIPSISFMDEEIMDTIEYDLIDLKNKIDQVYSQVSKIFQYYGSLPIEKSENSLKIHFPNLEPIELEKMIIELGLVGGIVYSNKVGSSSSARSKSLASSRSSRSSSPSNSDLTSREPVAETSSLSSLSTASSQHQQVSLSSELAAFQDETPELVDSASTSSSTTNSEENFGAAFLPILSASNASGAGSQYFVEVR